MNIPLLLLLVLFVVAVVGLFGLVLLFGFFGIPQLRVENSVVQAQKYRSPQEPAPTYRSFSWKFTPPGHTTAKKFDITIPTSAKRYAAYGNGTRSLDIWRYHHYALHRTPEIRALARYFQETAAHHQYNDYAKVANVIAFAQQNIAYAHDICSETGGLIDHPKYPLETLVDAEGDCEDQAILAGAILAEMGVDVALLMCQTHAALGIAKVAGLTGEHIHHAESETDYYYTEMTAPGWQPGEVPDIFRHLYDGGEFQVLPIDLIA